ncbi:hypothetical protein Pmani_039245 [Petrolisthes manimaculis]|uniref:Uncharacterized protein n=1 Tax=Petrolisthes manimaculis TaxID=1843537 RepID=A0AAE1TLJ3_9EUCA|nr:hypothetical protein Pmani_039245 [Petrolisthes manimaculis]
MYGTQMLFTLFTPQLLLLVLLLLLSLTPSATPGRLSSWHRVFVSWNTVNNTLETSMETTLMVPEGVNKVLYCSRECGNVPWCVVWCSVPLQHQQHQQDTTCKLLSIRVLPGYEEVDTGDVTPCYTSLSRDLVTGAHIIGGPSYFPQRVPENLVDGFYGYHMDECFRVEHIPNNTWLVVDFQVVVKFSTVIIYVQNNRFAPIMFSNVEVRTGMTRVAFPEDLRLYSLFGKFEGPASVAEVVEFVSPEEEGRLARYLSVQRVSDDLWFQVCHIEVY